MDNTLMVERTPEVIAAEINTIKGQTEKMLLHGVIEIGRRLTEAKALLSKRGDWGRWLEESVNYSQSTAENFMRLYREYCPQQPALPGAGGQVPAPNLSYTQALILLGIPEEARAGLIAQIDLESMSTRELQKAVQEKKEAMEARDQAIAEKKQVALALDQAQEARNQTEGARVQAVQEKEELEKALEGRDSNIEKWKEKARMLDLEVQEYKQKYYQEQDKVLAGSREMEEIKGELPSARKIAELDGKLKTVTARLPVVSAETKFEFYCKNLINDYKALTATLLELNLSDQAAKEKNRQAAHELLQNLADSLKEFPPKPKLTVTSNNASLKRSKKP